MKITSDIDLRAISLRHLKAVERVAEVQNVTRAAVELRRSQTAVTKSISEIESLVGERLFDRTSKGVTPTTHGLILARRTRSALDALQVAANSYSNIKGSSISKVTVNPVFSMDISSKRLMALIALAEHRDVSKAASAIKVTRAAIYNSIREFEALLDMELFHRQPGRLEAHSFTLMLVRQVKLAFAEIRIGLEELENLSGPARGKIVIGSLPLARTMLIPRAINHVLENHPQLHILTREGPYDVLETGLRSGEIDLIIGALRDYEPTADLKTESLFGERLAAIARPEHPLMKESSLTLEDALNHHWVLPPKNTPARSLFDNILQNSHHETPRQFIETSSLATLRGLLLESDRIALISEHQLYYELKFGMLAKLPIGLPGTYRPIGITMRANTTPSPGAKMFLDSLRSVAGDVHPEAS